MHVESMHVHICSCWQNQGRSKTLFVTSPRQIISTLSTASNIGPLLLGYRVEEDEMRDALLPTIMTPKVHRESRSRACAVEVDQNFGLRNGGGDVAPRLGIHSHTRSDPQASKLQAGYLGFLLSVQALTIHLGAPKQPKAVLPIASQALQSHFPLALL